MSLSNRITLASAEKMTAEQLSALPVDQLALVLEDVSALKERVKRLDGVMLSAMQAKYGDRARDLRAEKKIDTGTVRVRDGEYVVIADLPKKVAWDQKLLRDAEETVRQWGEDPAEYISTEMSVPEKSFTAWPAVIRKVFEPARTVSAGKATFKLERVA